MNKFKIGDRVRIYDSELPGLGWVTGISGDYIQVNCSKYDQYQEVHYKQCRRLVRPNPRRVIWVDLERNLVSSIFPRGAEDKFVEFIEHRRKKR